jgi:hypothetical protein
VRLRQPRVVRGEGSGAAELIVALMPQSG